MRKFIVVLIIAFLFFGCGDNNQYNGITGVWIVEEQGEVTQYHRYNVGIRSDQFMDNVYIISNLYRSGDNSETYLNLDGLDISISVQFNGNYTFSEGRGVLDPDFKRLTLEYRVNDNQSGISENVTAIFKRE